MGSPEAFRWAAAKVEGDADQKDDIQGEDQAEEKHICEEKRESFEMPWIWTYSFIYIFMSIYQSKNIW